MECYCDFEPASVYHADIHTARKRHRCCECDGIIEPGEHYEWVFGAYRPMVMFRRHRRAVV
jgi:hypothetical protein